MSNRRRYSFSPFSHVFVVCSSDCLPSIHGSHHPALFFVPLIGDLWPRKEEEKNQEEPEWIKNEREQFAAFRDKNKDGVLDREEVLDWILPVNYDHYQAEAKHLVISADADKNGRLTKEEIVEKYDLFVGSQATDFGEALTKHDEF
ncbi:hypothetical protein RRG08_007097 [Elysia crispata]|uniref:EF-hand domain-containing protein n=1 Tax=Elysia crispata TaxID=231223 RepID=A0AAE0YM65_9GAST|nr:hypothetical protein RRG08_007097 [Elysia crispata]